MEITRNEVLKSRMLRILSVNARISMQDIANKLGVTKVNVYGLFNELLEEYDIGFVPEISIDKLWKWEFIKKARLRTKRGIISEAMEELPLTGFGEYLILIKFIGKKPENDEITKAMGNSYVPQFIARISGEYDLMIYAVARSYEDAIGFTDALNKSLFKYNMLAYTNRIWGCFGFFPLSNKLIEQFDIFDTYKNLLFGLNGKGRETFTEIGKKFNQGPAQMLYAYDRLARTEILKRVTYFEAKPKATLSIAIMLKIENAKAFEESKNKWLMRVVKEYESKENEYVFMCDMANPKGMFIIMNFHGKERYEKFFSCIRSCLKGVEVSKMQISKTLLGNLGLRDFDMRYSSQYKCLERNKLVPSLKERLNEPVTENPNEI
ncbi:MAG: AsnC family protein [Candidatus Micrarchaeales archaeon]